LFHDSQIDSKIDDLFSACVNF